MCSMILQNVSVPVIIIITLTFKLRTAGKLLLHCANASAIIGRMFFAERALD